MSPRWSSAPMCSRRSSGMRSGRLSVVLYRSGTQLKIWSWDIGVWILYRGFRNTSELTLLSFKNMHGLFFLKLYRFALVQGPHSFIGTLQTLPSGGGLSNEQSTRLSSSWWYAEKQINHFWICLETVSRLCDTHVLRTCRSLRSRLQCYRYRKLCTKSTYSPRCHLSASAGNQDLFGFGWRGKIGISDQF